MGRAGIRHAGLQLLPRPLVLLTTCIVIAGAGLAWFMVRTVMQEQAVAAQAVRDAATAAASRVAERIVPELEGLERELQLVVAEGIGASGTVGPAPAAELIKATGDDGVLLLVRRDGLTAWPRGRLLYEFDPPTRPADDAAWPAGLRSAEQLELRARDYAAANAAYRALLAPTASNPRLRLAIEQRLARSLRKAKRPGEALTVLEQIIDAHQSDDSPAVAAAWYDRCALIEDAGRRQDLETCAVGLYGSLVNGRWRLEKPLYEFYADGARRWMQPLAGRTDVAGLLAREGSRLALARAAEAALRAWRTARAQPPLAHLALTDQAPPALVAWRAAGAGEAVLLVLGPASAAAQIFAPLTARYGSGHAVSIAANRAVLYPSSGGDGGRAGPVRTAGAASAQAQATITVEDGPTVWRVTAWPDAVRDSGRGVTVQTGAYLGTLALMLLSVTLAGYFGVRTISKELEVARLKSEFVSAISHEFRSPLSAISHLAELLDAGRVRDEDRKREYYRLIRGESGRLRRLVENLLNFARIEEGRQQYRLEKMPVAPWLRREVDEFQASPAAAGKAIVLVTAADLPPVRADAEALAMVLGNLLDNAVKYSPGSERVFVEASVEGRAVEIRVRDEGVGIADADQPHIFERFYRARESGQVSGAGLGLALVLRIVAAHGGTVAVRSRVGEGSTFTVRLPAWRVEEA
ncbi:MAG: integral rane sensor signal transduction histidine kinase [candidate division NC10 bacterium]|nr:integral rane sensor signal transduction histidine kinase [candidate division NC10 bacterium]